MANLNLPSLILKTMHLFLPLQGPVKSLSLSFSEYPFILIGHNKVSLVLLLFSLNKHNSLSLSSQERCSSLVIFMTFLWTNCNRFMSFCARDPRAEHSWNTLQVGCHESSGREKSPCLTCCACFIF